MRGRGKGGELGQPSWVGVLPTKSCSPGDPGENFGAHFATEMLQSPAGSFLLALAHRIPFSLQYGQQPQDYLLLLQALCNNADCSLLFQGLRCPGSFFHSPKSKAASTVCSLGRDFFVLSLIFFYQLPSSANCPISVTFLFSFSSLYFQWVPSGSEAPSAGHSCTLHPLQHQAARYHPAQRCPNPTSYLLHSWTFLCVI